MDTSILRKLSYGVYVISTWDNGRPTGCTANSVMQITSSPKITVALSLNHQNYTTECIKETGVFAVSVLAEDSAPSLIGGFGFRSGRDVDKFDGVDYKVEDFLPVISDSCGYLTCRVINTVETDTHTIFLGEVTGAGSFDKGPEMTYAYYHRVVKNS